MTKKEAADRKRDLAEMAECTPDQKARDWFRRPAGVQMMIQAQAEQIHEDPAECVARKYGIRGDADDKRDAAELSKQKE